MHISPSVTSVSFDCYKSCDSYTDLQVKQQMFTPLNLWCQTFYIYARNNVKLKMLMSHKYICSYAGHLNSGLLHVSLGIYFWCQRVNILTPEQQNSCHGCQQFRSENFKIKTLYTSLHGLSPKTVWQPLLWRYLTCQILFQGYLTST